MYVKDNMSASLITIGPEASIAQALDEMSNHKFHRLPVVDKDNHLLGLLTEGTVKANSPNSASSLSVFELNYLLNKLTVRDIMIKDVKTISPNELLEKAADVMRENEIGCLPVVENGILTGIITHKDIFTAFIDLLGYHQNGTRYCINIDEDKVGVMYAISEIFKNQNISISNLAVYHNSRGIELVVIATGENSDQCTEKLKEAGYNVTGTISLSTN